MKRSKMADLVAWKNEKDRKPLIIRGARQVGKTWLIKEFGSTYYEQMAYINFEKTQGSEMFLTVIMISTESSSPYKPKQA